MIAIKKWLNRPRSIYQYSNMAPRLAGQTSIVGVVLISLYLSLFWELRDKRSLKNLQFGPESLGVMSEYWYIESGLFIKCLTFDKNTDENHTCFGSHIKTTCGFDLSSHWTSTFMDQNKTNWTQKQHFSLSQLITYTTSSLVKKFNRPFGFCRQLT